MAGDLAGWIVNVQRVAQDGTKSSISYAAAIPSQEDAIAAVMAVADYGDPEVGEHVTQDFLVHFDVKPGTVKHILTVRVPRQH